MRKYIKPNVVNEDSPEFIRRRTSKIARLTQQIKELKEVEQSNFIIGLITEREDQLTKLQKVHDVSSNRRNNVRKALVDKINLVNEKITELKDSESETYKELILVKRHKPENELILADQKRAGFISTLSDWDQYYEEVRIYE